MGLLRKKLAMSAHMNFAFFVVYDALKKIYKIFEDWDGKLYCGLNLEWDY